MTTVGFGDFYPKTFIGRTTIVLAAFIGNFIISLVMVALNSSKEFSLSENKSFTLVRRLLLRRRINRLAGKSILTFLRSVRTRHKQEKDPANPLYKADQLILEETLERYLENFKIERQVLQPDEVPQEEKLRMLNEKVDTDIKHIEMELAQIQLNLVTIENITLSQAKAK